MMTWTEEDENGFRSIEITDQTGDKVCSISEDEENYIFDFGVASPNGLIVPKNELADPIEWAKSFIGNDMCEIHLEIFEDENSKPSPFLSFVDDEAKAVWQVWEVDE